MISFFIAIFILGLIILALAAFRIDYAMGRADGFVGDVLIILFASFAVSLLGMVGIAICTVR
jgi:hypothetical protein